jgi:hypothetical protein
MHANLVILQDYIKGPKIANGAFGEVYKGYA